jgi:hypothetical protein
MAIVLVAAAAIILIFLSRRSAPWWAPAAVIGVVAVPFIAGYVREAGEPDTSPGLLVFAGVLSVGALTLLEGVLRIVRWRRGRSKPDRAPPRG